MRYSIIFLSFTLLFFGCNKPNGADDSPSSQKTPTIHVDLDQAQDSLYMSEFFSDLQYVPLQTPKGRPIGRIRKIMPQKEHIGFFDKARKSVWIFDYEGTYINEIKIPQGRGPGELGNIEDVIITEENQIHVLGPLKIVVYDFDGSFIYETNFKFWIYKFTFISSLQEYIGYTANSLNTTLDKKYAAHHLIYFNKEGTIQKSSLPIKKGHELLAFFTPNKFPTFKNIQLFYPHLVDTVYAIQPSGTTPRYVLDYGEHSIPPEIFDRRETYGFTPRGRHEFIVNELRESEYVSSLVFFNETEIYIHFSIKPGNQHSY